MTRPVTPITVKGDVQDLPLGSQIVTALQGRPIANSSPTLGQTLKWDGKAWTPKTSYAKVTTKSVVNSAAETDLLNGEIIIAAGTMGSSQTLRLTASGDLLNNTGATLASPQIKLKFGGTTLIDSNVIAAVWASTPSALPWRVEAFIQNRGVTNSQWIDFRLSGALGGVAAATAALAATGEGIVATGGPMWTWDIRVVNSSALDTTVTRGLALTATLPTANALEQINLASAYIDYA